MYLSIKCVFLNTLKIAKPILHKNGDKLDCNNYKAITLLSNISKIYEKYIFFEKANFKSGISLASEMDTLLTML